MKTLHSNTNIDSLFSYYLESLATWRGGVCLIFLLFMVIATIRFDNLKWYWLVFLIWVGSISFMTGSELEKSPRILIEPLNAIRTYSRIIVVAVFVLLLLPTVKAVRGHRTILVLGGATAFFIFQVIFSIRFLMAGEISRALLGIVNFLLMYLTLGVGVSMWIQSPEDVRKLIRCCFSAGALIVAGSLAQATVNRRAVIIVGRMAGTTNNPQHLGITLALLLPIAFVLLLSKGERAFWRAAAAFVLSAAVIFIIWSGSRAAVLVGLVALIALFRTRLRLWLGATLVCGTLVAASFAIFSPHIEGSAHLAATNDSRTHVWIGMMRAILERPLIGSGSPMDSGENSYLQVGTKHGLMGLIPFGVAMILITRAVFRMHQYRRAAGRPSLLFDLPVAWLFALAVACMFEGYLNGVTTEFILLLYVMLAVVAALSDPIIVYMFQLEAMAQGEPNIVPLYYDPQQGNGYEQGWETEPEPDPASYYSRYDQFAGTR